MAPFDAAAHKLTSVIPEHQFDKMELKGDLLLLDYTNNAGRKLQPAIELGNKK